MAGSSGETQVSSRVKGNTVIVYVGDYLNRLTGERIERECRRQLKAGCRAVVLDFSAVGIVNSVGISILLGVIEAAERAGAQLVFCAVGAQNLELFSMMGLTEHIGLAADEATALQMITDLKVASG